MASSRKLVELPEAPTADPSDLLLIHDISANIDKKITAQNLPFSGGTGIQGVTGFYGPTGFQGATGIQGGTGIQGPGGSGGSQGATGIQGDTGVQGWTGIQGPGGSGGSQGATGIQGQTGASIALSLTANYLPKAATSTTLSNSVIYETGGNIGIDTTSPYVAGIGTNAAGLDIRGASNDGASLTLATTNQSTTPALCMYGYLLGGVIRVAIAQALSFHTNATERMVITSAGDVGINTSTPYSILELSKAGTVKANTDFLSITNTVNAADMVSTATSLLFRQWYYDVTTPAVEDCGRISFKAEDNWTSSSATRESSFSISVLHWGALSERLRIKPNPSTYIFLDDTETAWTVNELAAYGIDQYENFRISRVATSGGTYIKSFKGNTNPAFRFEAYNSLQPSALAAITIAAFVHDGAGALTYVSDSTQILRVSNQASRRMGLYGGGALELYAASLTHGMTDYLPTDAWCRIATSDDANPNRGGLKIIGASAITGPAMTLYAIGQSSCGIHSLLDIITGKVSGTGIQDLSSIDHALRLLNNATELLVIHGNGDTTIKGIVTAETTKRVACGGDSTGSTTTASGTVTLEINGTTYYLLRAAGA